MVSSIVATVFASTVAVSYPFNDVVANATEGNSQQAEQNSSLLGANTENLLENPGFSGDGNIITSWGVENTSSTSPTYYMENYRVYKNSGEYAQNYVTPKNDGSLDITHKRAVNNGYIFYLGQDVEVIEGHRYRLSADYKYVSGSNLEHVQIRTADNNTELSSSSWLPVTNPTAQNYTTTITAPSTTTMRVELKVLGFDDAIGEEGTVNVGNISLIDLDADLVQTTINELDTDSVKVEGSAEPNANIEIKAGSTILATGVVASDGHYSMTIPKQNAGTVVTATATARGKTSSANTTVVQGNIAQTTINALDTDSVKAEGSAEPNANIEIKAGSTILATGVVASDGRYSLTIPKQRAGTVVTATATARGKTSSANTTVIQGNITQTTIDPLNTESRTATGRAEPNATIVLKDQNNNQLASGTVGSDGFYSVTIPAQASGTVVTATATANGKTSSALTTVTQVAKSGTVEVKQDYYVGYDSRVQAEVTGDVTKVYLEVDGVRKSTVPVTGSFSYYAKHDITSMTQTVYLVGLDSAGIELDRARVTLKDGQLKIGSVSPDSFVVGTDAYVEGTYTGSVAKVALSVNGTILSKVPVGTDGTFRYYARKNITNANTDEVFVIGYNSSNTEISRKKVELYGAESLTGTITVLPNYYAVSSSYVEGTFTGNVKYVSLVVNGTEYSRTSVMDATNWRYYAKDKVAMGDTVMVKGYNSAGTVVDQKTVNVVLSPPGNSSITANDFVLNQDKYVTGTYDGDVKYVGLKVNGTILKKVPVPEGGTYSYYARPNILSTTDTVTSIAYDRAGVQVAEVPVRIR